VIIIQYEYSFLSKPLVTQLLSMLIITILKLANIKTVVIPHGVLHPENIVKNDLFKHIIGILLKNYYKMIVTITDLT